MSPTNFALITHSLSQLAIIVQYIISFCIIVCNVWDPFTSFIDPHGHYDTPWCHGPVRSFILLRSSAASSSTLFRRQDCRSKSNLPSRVGAGRVHTWLDRAILDRHWNEISCWLVFSGSGRILLLRLVGSLKYLNRNIWRQFYVGPIWGGPRSYLQPIQHQMGWADDKAQNRQDLAAAWYQECLLYVHVCVHIHRARGDLVLH